MKRPRLRAPLGIVWAAAHFYVDFSSHFSHGNVLLQIGGRLLDGVVFSFILGWLTLRTRSVLPATVAHGFENVFIISTFGFPLQGLVRILSWRTLAYVSFGYWPVQAEAVQKSGAAITNPTPQL